MQRIAACRGAFLALLAVAVTALNPGAGNAWANENVVLMDAPTAPVEPLAPAQLSLTLPVPDEQQLTVETDDRTAVAALFDAHYTPNLSVAAGWNGNVNSCNAGTTTQAYLDATIDMINYYRAMAGLPSVYNYASDNAGAQAAALIMGAQNNLSHFPPNSWACWSQAGYNSAGSSNIALGTAGPGAIRAYIHDYGSNNYFVGHRRWILYPRRVGMGTGSVSGNGARAANALDVFGPQGGRPGSVVEVAWPPRGYVPYQVVYDRWSFSLNNNSSANYANATISMSVGGTPVSLNKLTVVNGYGDNTVVWEPDLDAFDIGRDMGDLTVTVTISNIGSSSVGSMSYDVVIFDPATPHPAVFRDGFED